MVLAIYMCHLWLSPVVMTNKRDENFLNSLPCIKWLVRWRGRDNYKIERLAGSLCCLYVHVNSIAVSTRGKQTLTFTFSFILEFLPRMHNLDGKNGTTFVTLFPFLVSAII